MLGCSIWAFLVLAVTDPGLLPVTARLASGPLGFWPMWCAVPLVAGFLLTRRFRRWRSLVVLASIGAVVVAVHAFPAVLTWYTNLWTSNEPVPAGPISPAPPAGSTHVKMSVLALCAMITASGAALSWLVFAGLLWPGVLIRRMWAYERWRNLHISSTSPSRRDG